MQGKWIQLRLASPLKVWHWLLVTKPFCSTLLEIKRNAKKMHHTEITFSTTGSVSGVIDKKYKNLYKMSTNAIF